MTHCVFDVVAEDEQEDHVSDDMGPTAMEKHRRDETMQVAESGDLRWDRAPLQEEGVELGRGQHELVDEDSDADPDDRPVDERFDDRPGIFIADGEHRDS